MEVEALQALVPRTVVVAVLFSALLPIVQYTIISATKTFVMLLCDAIRSAFPPLPTQKPFSESSYTSLEVCLSSSAIGP
jgi:hypothetical protein